MRVVTSTAVGWMAWAACLGLVAATRPGLCAHDLRQEPPPASGAPAAATAAGQALPGGPGQPAPAQTPAEPAASASPAGSAPPVRLSMPDGQLRSHSIRVYVTRDIQPAQSPRLRLLRSHAVTRRAVEEAASFEPGIVAPGQEWIETVNGQQVRRTGTLLLFDLSAIEFGVKAMMRVMPVLSWTEGGSERVVVAPREVNLGNVVAAVGWTGIVVGAALLLVVALSRRGGGRPLQLLAAVDGHLSLAQAQIACWTLAVGGVVLGYGLVRLEIPGVPASLLVLMGASLATGGVGYFQDARQAAQAERAGVPVAPHGAALGDLVRVFPPGQAPELSLAKAQMLFWTVLLLVLFVSKSILDGAIWEVPWPLVALMGFSQAGYLAPKLASP